MSSELNESNGETQAPLDFSQRTARFVRETLAPNDIDPRLVFFRRSSSQAQEAYLEAARQLTDDNPAHRLFWGTALREGRGRSLTLLNLASALAKSYRVLVVDMNVSSPALGRMFQGLNGMRFAQLCSAWASDENEVARISLVAPTLSVISGESVHDRTFDLSTAEAVLERLRQLADIVLLDGPLMGSEAWLSRPIVPGARAILVVTEQDLADQAFEEALSTMDQSELAGCLINERGRKSPLLGGANGHRLKS